MDHSPASELSSLQTDVALLKQFNEKVAEPTFKDIQSTQKDIKTALQNLEYVHKPEFEKYQAEVDSRFVELKRKTWIQNTLSAIAGAVLTLLATYAVTDWINGG